VLFAPVAAEVAAEAIRAVARPFRAAGLQGWLRATDADGRVATVPLSALAAELADALRDLDLLIASRQDLAAADGPSALARLRQWAGPRPQLVVTAGPDGAWLDDGHGPPSHIPAEVVEGRHTVGAGDAFAAVLVARRGAGLDLQAAAVEASAATARYLARRPGP
jgi:sugar/nucleoside kinase (ribokinase family)